MHQRAKERAAAAALAFIQDDTVIGVGTGSTAECFITLLATIKHRLEGCVASSVATEKRLRAAGIPVMDLNAVNGLALYVDGADEVNARGEMIKGGGGALTREKIIASVAKQFICLVDESKWVKRLGEFPIAVEVLPLARSFVAREIVKLGASPSYREGFITDNGNVILDVYQLDLLKPIALEESLKLIPGVIESGLFAKRLANQIIVGTTTGVNTFKV